MLKRVQHDKYTMQRFIITIILLLLILSLRFYFFYKNQPTYTEGQQLSLQTTLLTNSTLSGKYQKIAARLPNGQRVFVSLASYPRYSYGQTLEIAGTLHLNEIEGKTIYSMSYPNITLCHSGLSRIDSGCARFSLTRMTIEFIAPLRARIIWLFSALPQPAGNLLLGIVFGISEGMPKRFADALQGAGVLHVIAASGMNVTIIGSMFASLFGRVVRRQYAVVMTIVGIILYAGLAGFSASIVRASIMGILVFSAQILGRQTLALYGLFLAGFLMLFFQPFLLFDTGFQLSFMATWGLIVFNPLLQFALQKKEWFIVLLAQTDFLTTIIASIAALPILLGTFGSYSPASIIANLLVLWEIPILMLIGGVGAAVGLLIPLFGQWIMYLSLPFLFYFESVVWFFSKAPMIQIPSLSWQLVVGYYLFFFATAHILKTKIAQKKEDKIAEHTNDHANKSIKGEALF